MIEPSRTSGAEMSRRWDAYLKRQRCRQCSRVSSQAIPGPRRMLGGAGFYYWANRYTFCEVCSAALWEQHFAELRRLQRRRVVLALHRSGVIGARYPRDTAGTQLEMFACLNS